MDYTQPGFWVAIGVGGSLVASLSAISQFTSKKSEEQINYRAILRDFCIGAFLTSALYMFIPESLLTAGQDAVNGIVSKVGARSPSSDIELQTGPAKF